MKRIHIYSAVTALTLLALCMGAFGSDRPVIQYLGNATGVLLGFVLGVWWQEEEKARSRKEKIDLFEHDFEAFLPKFEECVRNQITMTCNAVFDSVIEWRLPLPEIEHFRKQADELELETEFRRKLAAIVSATRVIDEYIDFGAERITKWHSNFRSKQEELNRLVLEMKATSSNQKRAEPAVKVQ